MQPLQFLVSYTTLKYTNMKGVKRKAEQPTLAAFGFTNKVIHNGEKILSLLFLCIFFFGVPNV